MKKIILFLLMSTFALSQDFLVINGFSKHLESNAEYINGKKVELTERNWGLGLEREFEERDILGIKIIPFAMGMGFIDSYDKLAGTLGGGIKKRIYLPYNMVFDLGGFAFGVYKNEFDGVRLGIVPVASVGTKKIRLNIAYIPAYKVPQAITFVNLSVKLW